MKAQAYQSESDHTGQPISRLAVRLAAIVREHGHPCRVVGNTLRCASVGVHCQTGVSRWTIDTIPATSGAVAVWLGY